MSDTGRALGTGRRDVQFTSDPGPFKSFLSVPLGETSVPGPFGPVLGRRPDGRTPVRINLQSASQTTDGRRRRVRPACAAAHCRRPCATPGRTQDDGRPDGDGTRRAPDCSAVTLPSHSVAECQFSTNLIITFDRNKIHISKWYHFVSLVKAIRMTYNKALTHQVMTLIRGIFKFTTSLYDLK